MVNPIKIRAHHLLCIPRFYRGGYDQKFADNMKRICKQIRKNSNVRIKVLIGELDDLCLKCPYKLNKRCIQSKKIGEWVVSQDMKVAKYLNIKPNSVHKAKDIFKLGMEKVNQKTINRICENCIYLENCKRVGINNSFRKDLDKK